jgi:flavorubredoxin
METRVDEIAERIYRLSTFVPGTAGPAGLTFNQFLVDADEPLLFHCGQRSLFASVSSAAARIIALERLRWITFSHIESDECGSMNEWLGAAPRATAAHGVIGCNIWLTDAAIRPPRVLADREVLDLGGRKVRRINTPHLPHCWDAGLIYEETTGTLFCSDLFTHAGDGPALTDRDIVAPSLALESRLGFTSLTPNTAPMIRKLAALSPRKLAVMHGSSFSGDVSATLEALASHYDAQLRAAVTI